MLRVKTCIEPEQNGVRFFVSDILSYDVHFNPCYWNRWLQDFVVFKQCLVKWLCMDMTSLVTHGWFCSETLRPLHDEWRVRHAFSTMSCGDYQCNSHDILSFLSQCKKNQICIPWYTSYGPNVLSLGYNIGKGR